MAPINEPVSQANCWEDGQGPHAATSVANAGSKLAAADRACNSKSCTARALEDRQAARSWHPSMLAQRSPAAALPLAGARQQVNQPPVQLAAGAGPAAHRGSPTLQTQRPCSSLPAPCSRRRRHNGPIVSARGLLLAPWGCCRRPPAVR